MVLVVFVNIAHSVKERTSSVVCFYIFFILSFVGPVLLSAIWGIGYKDSNIPNESTLHLTLRASAEAVLAVLHAFPEAAQKEDLHKGASAHRPQQRGLS